MSDERSPEQVQQARASISVIVKGMESGPEPETVDEVKARLHDKLDAKHVAPTADGLSVADRRAIRQQSLRRALEKDSIDPSISQSARDEAKRLLALLPSMTSAS
jgi:hypothetical protein